MPSVSLSIRNATLDATVAIIGASPVIQIRTGSPPGAEDADSGTLLASYTLSPTWATPASEGSIHLLGMPLSVTAVADGTAAHYSLKSSTGTTFMTGTAGIQPADPDEEPPELILDAVDFFIGGTIQITSWYINTPA